jgi:xanthine dehydrogenase molybdopterin-binding subunit B
MNRSARRATAAAFGSAVFAFGSLGLAGPASASSHVQQDGLVNVNVGDVTILEDVNIGVAAQVAANVCGVKVGPVAVLGRAVDRSGDTSTVCETDQGDVTISQN